ncbi:hypothetical protein HS088_TW04G00444 [Tripterygium wilfordii]|uniref:Uncharacterized protein n=1 Tax=Tripterygium wilfordii TaxID=458696 RepID=A0A7J7DQD9_TRIWF|nr:uncharacterized protein LOC119997887 [Tripterygium wilfordii]KAF5748489.1 hypothetical protein HS088_TW04G00444 [Tripterygium wilfordii]
MTKYGTIPTEPVAPSRQQIVKEGIQSCIGTKIMEGNGSAAISHHPHRSQRILRENRNKCVTDTIVVALSTGVVVVLVHGALRTTDDLAIVDVGLGEDGTSTSLRHCLSFLSFIHMNYYTAETNMVVHQEIVFSSTNYL